MRRSTDDTARAFGRTLGIACGLLALLHLWRGHRISAAIFGLFAALLILLSLVRPSALQGPSRVWSAVTARVGWLITHLVLSVVFIAMLTPFGLILRLTGWDPLRLKRPATGGSGWTPYPERFSHPAHYERLY